MSGAGGAGGHRTPELWPWRSPCPDWPAEGAVAEVSRAVLDGVPVRLRADADAVWPRAALPPYVTYVTVTGHPGAVRDSPAPAHTLWVTDRVIPPAAHEAVLRPPSLSVGVGAARGVRAGEVVGLIERVLAEAGFSPASVAELASVGAKACEPGLLAAAVRLGVPLRTFAPATLAAVSVPGPPSEAARAAVGTPSVAEAAALYAVSATGSSGGGGPLLAPKRTSAPEGGRTGLATAAVARRPPESWLAAAYGPPVRTGGGHVRPG